MIVGCYILDLYCANDEYKNDRNGKLIMPDRNIHGFDEFPHTFTGERRQDCERAARNIGWMINNKTGICLCPKCSGKI